MKFGVLVFPGLNCDQDACNVIADVAHQPLVITARRTSA
jgi:phosphoribosylformylglycinamidine (FGAM) synthase-like amidotransferase family enzyme